MGVKQLELILPKITGGNLTFKNQESLMLSSILDLETVL